jgi:uncharacterized protein YjbI with pentapeptide repeats
MYTFVRCAEPGCPDIAFAGGKTCLAHSPATATADAAAMLESADSHRDLCFQGATFEGLKLSGKRFYGCSFMGVTLRGVLLTNAVFRLCFFDGATIDSSDLSHLDAQFCSFGGAHLSNVSFENSEILHDSFVGAEITECTFNNSNLYDSRFILCRLVDSDFIDCNLKRVYMIPAKEEKVSYKYSNTMEAIRDREHLYV